MADGRALWWQGAPNIAPRHWYYATRAVAAGHPHWDGVGGGSEGEPGPVAQLPYSFSSPRPRFLYLKNCHGEPYKEKRASPKARPETLINGTQGRTNLNSKRMNLSGS
jgi:hypothetical protein